MTAPFVAPKRQLKWNLTIEASAVVRADSPPTNAARVPIPASMPYIGWVYCRSPFCSERFFTGYFGFLFPSNASLNLLSRSGVIGPARTQNTLNTTGLILICFWSSGCDRTSRLIHALFQVNPYSCLTVLWWYLQLSIYYNRKTES